MARVANDAAVYHDVQHGHDEVCDLLNRWWSAEPVSDDEGLDREGVVVIKGVVDPEHVRVVRERVLGDVEAYERDSTSVKIEQGGQVSR